MATQEEIQAARKRVEDARALLALEQERRSAAARAAENDVLLGDLLAEERRILQEVEVARAEADHQEAANAKRREKLEAGGSTTPPAPVPEQPVVAIDPDGPTQPSFPGLGAVTKE